MHDLFTRRRFLLPHGIDSVPAEHARERRPSVLVLACSDSILDTSLIPRLQTSGSLVVRRPGNRVTSSSDLEMGFADVLERLVAEAGVTDLVICGHSCCSAARATRSAAGRSESGESWYDRTLRRMARAGACNAQAQENVMAQLDALRQAAGVRWAMARGVLRLHGAFYLCESGTLLLHDPEAGQFLPPPEPATRQRHWTQGIFHG